MKKYLFMATVEGGKYIQRVIPCEYVNNDEYEIMDRVCEDNRDLTVAYVAINNLKTGSFGKRIYAAFTEEQYKQFDECRRRVDFAGIIEGYKDMP